LAEAAGIEPSSASGRPPAPCPARSRALALGLQEDEKAGDRV